MLSAPGSRRAIRTALTESILRLCREHGLHSGQIDGIICIAGHRGGDSTLIDDDNNDGDELVIKVHETLATSVKRENGIVMVKDEPTVFSLLHSQSAETSMNSASAIMDERFVASPTSPYHFPRRTVLKNDRWSVAAPSSVGATECRACDVIFAGFTQLSEHNEAVHGAFTCAGCLRTFTSRSNLERHARLHTGTRPYACTVCGRAFSRRDHLTNHAARHALKCAACASRFADRDMLAAHIVHDHCAQLVGVCTRCNKGFASDVAFDEHKKMHPAPAVSAMTNLEHCEQCAFVCADRLTLAKHRLGHDGAARCYTCLACASTFTDPLSYAAHLETSHATDTDIFECCVCRQLCSTLSALHHHEMSHLQPPEGSASEMTLHGLVSAPPLAISPVQVSPESVQDLSSSAAKKQHQCALCSLQFDSNAELLAHAALLNHYEPQPGMENGVEVVQPESPPPTAADTTYGSEFVVTSTPTYVIEVDDEAESTGSAASSQIKMKPLHSMWPRTSGSRSHHRRKASPEKSVDVPVLAMNLSADDSIGTGDGGSLDDADGEGDTSLTSMRPSPDTPAGPHTCGLCGQVEGTFAQLEAHCVLEHNRSPCVYCGKTFAQKANRDRHLCLHTGDRPYACPNCDERFARGDKLKNHRVRAHNIQYPTIIARRDALQRKEWKFKEWVPPATSTTPHSDWPTDSIHSTGEWQAESDMETMAQQMDEPMGTTDENEDMMA